MFTAILMAIAVGGGLFGKCTYDESVLLKDRLSVVKKTHEKEVSSIRKDYDNKLRLLRQEIETEKADCQKRVEREIRRCSARKTHASEVKSYKLTVAQCKKKLRAMALDLVKKEQQTLK